MNNASHIEPFIADFFDWYFPFLKSVKDLGLGKNFTDSPYDEAEGSSLVFSVLDRALYETEEWFINGKIKKGILPAALELEEEVRGQLHELQRVNSCSVNPYFKVLNGFGNPQYNLFVTALEFFPQKDSNQRVAAYLRYEDSLGCFDTCYNLEPFFNLFFNSSPIVPGIKMPHLNDRWRGYDHPQGADKGHIVYNAYRDYDGNFFYGNRKLFGFHVNFDENCRGYVLETPVAISRDYLKSGALASFLEMLEVPSGKEK